MKLCDVLTLLPLNVSKKFYSHWNDSITKMAYLNSMIKQERFRSEFFAIPKAGTLWRECKMLECTDNKKTYRSSPNKQSCIYGRNIALKAKLHESCKIMQKVETMLPLGNTNTVCALQYSLWLWQ